MSRLEVSIVVPVYNNGQIIEELNHQIIDWVEPTGMNYEIIYVNDGSKDDSWRTLSNISDHFHVVKTIFNKSNVGQQKAILIGLKQAFGSKIIVMDADLQDKPSVIPGLIKSMTASYSATFVKRKGNYQPELRMLSSRVFKSMVKFLSGLDRQAGTYFIIDREVLERILTFKCRYPYITMMIACSGCNINYLEAERNRRYSGKSAYNSYNRIKAGLMALHCLIWCRFRYSP